MPLINFYLNLKITTRIGILCACYSCGILLAAYGERVFGPGAKSMVVWGCLLVGAGFGLLNMRAIGSSIQRVLGHVETIASGDLACDIKVRRRNEISKILTAIGAMARNQSDVLLSIKRATTGMAASSRELGQYGSEMLEAGRVQKTRVEVVSSASTAMLEVSEQVCELAGSIQEGAKATELDADQGRRAAQMNLEAMTDVLTDVNRAVQDTEALIVSADQIKGIVGSITEIAQQTNLLALNATIEAAHAGQFGQGFAVVAGAVGSLAERSAREAEAIGAMIHDLSERVLQAKRTMDRVVERVQDAEGKTRLTAGTIDRIVARVHEGAKGNARIAEAVKGQAEQVDALQEEVEPLFMAILNNNTRSEGLAQIGGGLATATEAFGGILERFRLPEGDQAG